MPAEYEEKAELFADNVQKIRAIMELILR